MGRLREAHQGPDATATKVYQQKASIRADKHRWLVFLLFEVMAVVLKSGSASLDGDFKVWWVEFSTWDRSATSL